MSWWLTCTLWPISLVHPAASSISQVPNVEQNHHWGCLQLQVPESHWHHHWHLDRTEISFLWSTLTSSHFFLISKMFRLSALSAFTATVTCWFRFALIGHTGAMTSKQYGPTGLDLGNDCFYFPLCAVSLCGRTVCVFHFPLQSYFLDRKQKIPFLTLFLTFVFI